jgi:hypothetical protein
MHRGSVLRIFSPEVLCLAIASRIFTYGGVQFMFLIHIYRVERNFLAGNLGHVVVFLWDSVPFIPAKFLSF